MNSFERRNKIVDMVNTQGSVLVLDLSNLFGISEVTIRADLRLLEEKGLLTRFHGGAARPGSNLTESDNQEVILEDRYQLASDPKKRIAKAAAALIKEGMTVILDSGSTTLLIAEELVNMNNITVITNSLPAAFALSDNKDITLVVCGGTVRHKTHSMHYYAGGLWRHGAPQNAFHARHHCRTFTARYLRRPDVCRGGRH